MSEASKPKRHQHEANAREIQNVSIRVPRPNPRNVRTHSKKQVAQIAESIRQFGFTSPIIVDQDNTVLAGNGRLAAAKHLGLARVPIITVAGLTETARRAYALADNRLADKAGYDRARLALELSELTPLLHEDGLDIELTGFDPVEADSLLHDLVDEERDPADEIPPLAAIPVSRSGDTWLLGTHRLLCGDARDEVSFRSLMAGERASMVAADPPFNVQIRAIVGRGRIKHREFKEASGEMTPEAFTAFLAGTLSHAAAYSNEGALHYVFMDWRHLGEMLAAGKTVYTELKNLVVWVKNNAGQGSFYRSRHELIFVFKHGDVPNLNNVELGRHGRSRSNVWEYAGVNSFRAGRLEELSRHPTAKPVALIADAMRDCTRRGDIVLDPFMGAGTTIMAAERVGRRGYGIEIDPLYADATIRRWQDFTKRDAILSGTRKCFGDIERARSSETSGRRR